MISLAFEGAVALVLILVAGLCWRLDRRLTALRSGQDGMQSTVIELSEAAARAEAGVRGLRAASDRVGHDLDEKLAQARAMADELRLLVDYADGAPSSRPPSRRSPSGASRASSGGGAPAETRERSSANRPIDPLEEKAARLLARMRGVR